MIHCIDLNPETLERLTDVVRLQINLLRYGAGRSRVSQRGLQAYLKGHEKFKGQAGKVAQWVWDFPKSLVEPLEQFAWEGRRETTLKKDWVERIAAEVEMFLAGPKGRIKPPGLVTKWEQAGVKLLRAFYDVLTDSKFPPYIFSEDCKIAFDRYSFLQNFPDSNRKLYVCAACDEFGFQTRMNDEHRAEIDHFLPKQLYPHFSCHPFNLVPVCHHCNGFAKRGEDPLYDKRSKQWRPLKTMALPYRAKVEGVGSELFLEVDTRQPKFNRLRPVENHWVTSQIEVLAEIYNVPERWNENIDRIGETLFRRMRQFLRDTPSIPNGVNMQLAIMNNLDQLLYYYADRENEYCNQGKDPYAVALMWWLATLINDEVEQYAGDGQSHSPGSSALLNEVLSWFGQNLEESKKRSMKAQRVRAIVKSK